MVSRRGILDLQELSSLVQSGAIDTVIVGFSDCYGRLLGKRFAADHFINHVAHQGTHGCNYLLTVDMEMEPVAGYEFANWDSGYGDFHITPDLDTLCVVSWLERTALVICDVDSKVAPRSLLRSQIQATAKLGLCAQAASELEYYLFENSYRDAQDRHFHNLTSAGWYLEDYHLLQATRKEDFHGAFRRHLTQSGIPVESTKGEWGLGQHEINVVYSDIASMADRHVLLKQCAREIADQQNVSVTFMAKVKHDQAGSSCHIHISLWKNTENIFAGKHRLGSLQCSDFFRWFLAGWIKHTPDWMPFYAPNINSYKRYQLGSWAPTSLAWSLDNRTAGFRVVGHESSLRIECRIPGADCNPYLAYTAALASGLDGIRQQLEPPEPFQGNAYTSQGESTIPLTFEDAIHRFSSSDLVRNVLGDAIQQHYTHFFQTELKLSQKHVTDWERTRYFERI